MIEFVLRTTVPIAACWVAIALLYDKVYKKIYSKDESVYNPTNTGVKKPDAKNVKSNTLAGITAVKRSSSFLLEDEKKANEANEEKETKETEIEATAKNLPVLEVLTPTPSPISVPLDTETTTLNEVTSVFNNHVFDKFQDYISEDEIEECKREETKYFKSDEYDDIYMDTPYVSHTISI